MDRYQGAPPFNAGKIMNIESIKATLEIMRERAKNPLYNPLETGFRHSKLSIPETIGRYKEFCQEVDVDCEAILKEMDK